MGQRVNGMDFGFEFHIGKWYETTEIGLINYAVYDLPNEWKCDHILQSHRRWQTVQLAEAEIDVLALIVRVLFRNVCDGRS